MISLLGESVLCPPVSPDMMSPMKINKELIIRIYIVLAVMWSLSWLIRWGNDYDGIFQHEIIINSLIPIPLYFAIKWILKSIK